jgi:hypothetical protein
VKPSRSITARSSLATTSPARRLGESSSSSREGGPGLLDLLDLGELVLEPFGDVLRLLLPSPVPVPPLLPLAHLPSLLQDPAPLVDVEAVVVLVPYAGATALRLERAPPARELPHRSRLCLELDDPGHPLEQCPIVRHDDQPSPMAVEKRLEKLEPGEVEVVRRLVEEEHVSVRGEDRLQLCPSCLAAGAPRPLRLLRQVRDREAGRLAAHPSRVRRVEICEHAKERRLADPVRADHADPAAGRHREGDAVEDHRVTERLAYRTCGERTT